MASSRPAPNLAVGFEPTAPLPDQAQKKTVGRKPLHRDYAASANEFTLTIRHDIRRHKEPSRAKIRV